MTRFSRLYLALFLFPMVKSSHTENSLHVGLRRWYIHYIQSQRCKERKHVLSGLSLPVAYAVAILTDCSGSIFKVQEIITASSSLGLRTTTTLVAALVFSMRYIRNLKRLRGGPEVARLASTPQEHYSSQRYNTITATNLIIKTSLGLVLPKLHDFTIELHEYSKQTLRTRA